MRRAEGYEDPGFESMAGYSSSVFFMSDLSGCVFFGFLKKCGGCMGVYGVYHGCCYRLVVYTLVYIIHKWCIRCT